MSPSLPPSQVEVPVIDREPTSPPAHRANERRVDATRRGRPVCCILGASLATRNLGVSALAASTIAAALRSFPDARIFLLDYGRVPETCRVKFGGRDVDVELVNLRFSWKILLRNNIARLIATALALRLVPSKTLRARLMARNPCLKAIADADILCSLAGGDSFSDIYGLRRLFYVALPQLLVLAAGKPLILLPQTLGPFQGRVANAVAGFILRHAHKVYARDRESGPEVRSLMRGAEDRLDFSYDMAFLLEPFAPANRPAWLADRSRPLVGLNVSGLLYNGGYTEKNMFGLKADYRELVGKIIAHFIEQRGADVVLVPHVFGPPDYLESDPTAGAAVYRELEAKYRGRLHVVAEEFSQHEMKYLIGRCDFFLGSRMHACIAALSQSVPAVGLAYSKKFLGVLRTVGAEKLVVDLRDCEVDEVIRRIDAAYAARESLRGELARRMPEVQGAVAGLFARALS